MISDVQDGEIIQTIVHADGGKTNRVDHMVVYTVDEVKTITYKCTGTTLNFSCKGEDNDEVFWFDDFVGLFDDFGTLDELLQ